MIDIITVLYALLFLSLWFHGYAIVYIRSLRRTIDELESEVEEIKEETGLSHVKKEPLFKMEPWYNKEADND